MSEELPPTRLPFDVEFFTAAKDFSANILARIPELEGVAIVPMWAIDANKIPPGYLVLSPNSRWPHVGALYKMLMKLAVFGVDVHQKLADGIAEYSKYSTELKEEIKRLENELATAKGQLGDAAASGE